MREWILVFVLTVACSSAHAFTVATQNLWHKRNDFSFRAQQFSEALVNFTPDIIGFQEAFSLFDGKSLYNLFLKQTGFNSHFKKTNTRFFYFEGNAISSGYQFLQVGHFGLPRANWIERKNAVFATLKLPDGNQVRIINFHFSAFRSQKGVRQRQFNRINRWLQVQMDRFDNIVVMGDFNIERDELDLLDPLFDAGFQMSHDGAACSFCEDNPWINHKGEDRRFDYVFYKMKNYKRVNSGILFKDRPIADHYGIWSEFAPK